MFRKKTNTCTVKFFYGGRGIPIKMITNSNVVFIFDFSELELIRIRNSLFTACKVGDLDALNDILSKLEKNAAQNEISESKSTEDSVVENKCENQTDSTSPAGPQPVSESRTPRCVELVNTSFGDQGRTLLHIASTQGHKDIITRLLGAGADPSIK